MKESFSYKILQNTCPSIAIRVMQEIMNVELTKSNRDMYEKLTLQGVTINTVLHWQMPDGYFGTRIHTPPSNSKIWSHEGCVRYLLEMGFTIEFEPLKKALDVMLVEGWEKEFIGSKAGQVLGVGIIRASLFAQAGLHDYDFIQSYIQNALDSFDIIATAKGLPDMAVLYKDKYIYKDGKCLPTVYDFRILAFTYSWRTKNNINMLSKAYKNLYEWLPFPPTYIKAGSQLIAPFGSIRLPLNKDFDESIGFPWFDFYEMSARMGMLTDKSPFYNHFQSLLSEVFETNGDIFNTNNKKGYIGFSSYSGLALEDDWRIKQNKINDLTFRCYLIESIINRTK